MRREGLHERLVPLWTDHSNLLTPTTSTNTFWGVLLFIWKALLKGFGGNLWQAFCLQYFPIWHHLFSCKLLKASFMKMHIKNSSNSPYCKTQQYLISHIIQLPIMKKGQQLSLFEFRSNNNLPWYFSTGRNIF